MVHLKKSGIKISTVSLTRPRQSLDGGKSEDLGGLDEIHK